jgi:SAM-dependent methyltransferase
MGIKYKSLNEYREYLMKDDKWAFITSWDYDPISSPRVDVVELMDIKPGDKILDVGCSGGKTLKYIKDKYSDVELYGIEPDKKWAGKAKKYGEIFTGKLDEFLKTNKVKFNSVIMADVIEHLLEPWIDVKETVNHMVDNGCLYVSIPNFFHHTVMYNLFECGSFSYRSNDIINRGHLRYFTMGDCIQLLDIAGFKNLKIYGNRVYSSERIKEVTNKLQEMFRKDFNFDIYQFVIKATRV